MKTPKTFENNLKAGIITPEMLSACLYSVNKRAKNCRDKVREIRNKRMLCFYWCDKYDNEGKNEEKEAEYYNMKEVMLSLLVPKCVHKNSHDEYFLYYEVNGYSFHSPILPPYIDKTLNIIDIGDLVTYGSEISNLISIQFCKKLVNLINSKEYKYVK